MHKKRRTIHNYNSKQEQSKTTNNREVDSLLLESNTTSLLSVLFLCPLSEVVTREAWVVAVLAFVVAPSVLFIVVAPEVPATDCVVAPDPLPVVLLLVSDPFVVTACVVIDFVVAAVVVTD